MGALNVLISIALCPQLQAGGPIQANPAEVPINPLGQYLFERTTSLDNLGVVIPVRLESERVKHKVLLPFGDCDSLLAWKINQLKQAIDPSQIFVSTEADQLKRIAFDCGVRVHHRDPKLAVGNAKPFREIITGIVSGIEFEHIAWVTVVVPLMGPEMYRQAFDAYGYHVVGAGAATPSADATGSENSHDSLVSVNMLKDYLWDDQGALNYKADRNHVVSQNLPNIYRVTNGLYMRPRADILQNEYFIGANPYRHVVEKAAGIDIDHYEDYEMAMAMMQVRSNAG